MARLRARTRLYHGEASRVKFISREGKREREGETEERYQNGTHYSSPFNEDALPISDQVSRRKE